MDFDRNPTRDPSNRNQNSLSKYPRIGFLIGQLGRGGAERQIYLTCIALKQLGVNPTVLTFDASGTWYERLKQADISVLYIRRRHKLDFQRIKILRQKIVASKIKLLFCFGSAELFYARLACISLPTLVIPNLRNQTWDSYSAMWMERILFPATPRYVTNSKTGSQYLQNTIKVPRKKIIFIPNAIERREILENGVHKLDPRPSRDHFGEIWCAWVGSFNNRKDPSLLLNICNITHRIAPYIYYLVVGDGPARIKLEHESHMQKLSNWLHFTGELDNATGIWKFVDFGLSTSRIEGTPNVLLEAMVWGKPYIAPSVGDIPEWIRDGENGLVSKTRSANELADLVVRVASDPILRERLCRGAQQTAFKVPSPLEVGSLYLELSDELVRQVD